MNELHFEMVPKPEYVSSARLFVAEAARLLGLSEEQVGDLKIAISEICTGALQNEAEGKISIKIQDRPDSLAVTIDSPGNSLVNEEEFDVDGTTGEIRGAMSLEVIRTLFPDADLGPSTIRLQVPKEAGQPRS